MFVITTVKGTPERKLVIPGYTFTYTGAVLASVSLTCEILMDAAP